MTTPLIHRIFLVKKTLSRATENLSSSPSWDLLRLSWILIILIVSALRLNAASGISQTAKLEKLAPEIVKVHVESGKGSTSLIFALRDGGGVPGFRLTPAVGNTRSIPEPDITFAWSPQASPGPFTNRTILTGELKISTSVFVEPGVDYKGRIIFVWPDSEQLIDFTVVNDSSQGFDLSESKLDLVLGPNQPTTVNIKVKNTGTAEIRKIVVSTSPLVDGETQHRTALPTTISNLQSSPIVPSQQSEITIALPAPTLAGSYTGILDVVANDSVRKSIPIVLHTRGPIIHPRLYFLPFVLFLITLVLGFIISAKLNEWFNAGGLQQSQSLLSLQQTDRGLNRLLAQLAQWETNLESMVFPLLKTRVEQSRLELRETLAAYFDLQQEQLSEAATRFLLTLTQSNLLRGFAEVAMKRWIGASQKAKLLHVLAALDRIPPNADVNAYRESLKQTLSEAADDSGASLAAVNEDLPRIPRSADLRARIKFMDRLYALVVLVVVFISAYQIFYAHQFDFGTLLDYLGVFLWTLGLTQTGSQILARARSTYSAAP